MKCPYCGKEMKHGTIQFEYSGYFFEQNFFPDGSERNSVAQRKQRRRKAYLAGALSAAFQQSNLADCTEAYLCEDCKKVVGIFPYQTEQDGFDVYQG